MTIRIPAVLVLMTALAGCDGNTLNNVPPDPAEEVPVPAPGTDGGISRDGLPPGTSNPSRSATITRFEPQGGVGDGYVTSVRYDAATDTFEVDNLGFDGDNGYGRGVAVASLGPYAVYEAASVYPDSVTGAPINQLTHRALLAVSPSGQTEFAIVRTGAYVGYGFGGFIYKRNGPVTLPTSGQAAYSGQYAGLRDFDGRGGLEYATGDMTMAIDFRDFNEGNAVQGFVTNRRVFDIAGNDITGSVVSALATKLGNGQSALPTIALQVGPGVMDVNGEIVGGVVSNVARPDGSLETFETGKYYAILAGTGAQEVVGVVVVEADDPRYSGVTVRETGGFILTRP